MLPVLQIGPLAVQLPGLLLLAGVWFGLTLAERSANRHAVARSDVSNLVFYALVGGVLGARLAYALRFAELYLRDPLGLLALNPNTLVISEGVLIGLLVAGVYALRRALPLWAMLDALTPGMALFAVALALAHLSSGDAFGSVTGVPWAIELWGARRHPTQIYELILALGALALVLRLDRERPAVDGHLFLLWVAAAALSRLFVGGFRGDSVIVLEVMRRGQVAALLSMAGALILLRYRSLQEQTASDRVSHSAQRNGPPLPTPDGGLNNDSEDHQRQQPEG